MVYTQPTQANKRRLAAFWYANQVFCEAAEMLLRRKDTGNIGAYAIDKSLSHEIQMWQNKFVRSCAEMKSALEHLNEAVPNMYGIDKYHGMVLKQGTEDETEHINDKIRRDAAHLIRMYMRSRNAFPENEQPDRVEHAINRISSKFREQLFSEPDIESVKIN